MAEFINIDRRILLTEHLSDAVDESSKIRMSKESRFLIKRLYGEYKYRFDHKKKDLIFSESDIKKLKGSFSGDNIG